jgi:small subunit ribosomal protein S4
MENVCKECRRAGDKLFLKGDRCLSPKCAITRRVSAQSGKKQSRFSKKSEYGLQLAEKQKAKAEYGLREKQFRNTFVKSAKSKKISSLLQGLELRLDNVVYRSGWAHSRQQARQLVTHGHVKVNDHLVDIPSYEVKIKDVVEPLNKDLIAKTSLAKATNPNWIKVAKDKAEIVALPEREEIDSSIDEQLIVEYYSR